MLRILPDYIRSSFFCRLVANWSVDKRRRLGDSKGNIGTMKWWKQSGHLGLIPCLEGILNWRKLRKLISGAQRRTAKIETARSVWPVAGPSRTNTDVQPAVRLTKENYTGIYRVTIKEIGTIKHYVVSKPLA
jgi:hypothetical protein